jgi:hypothetical protein
MNERIRQLAEQAFFDEATSQPSTKMYTFSEHKMEKFAELIAKECIEISKKIETDLKSSDMFTESNAASNAAGLVAYRIAQNFGVEK